MRQGGGGGKRESREKRRKSEEKGGESERVLLALACRVCLLMVIKCQAIYRACICRRLGHGYRASCSLCSVKSHARIRSYTLVRSYARSLGTRLNSAETATGYPNVSRGSVIFWSHSRAPSDSRPVGHLPSTTANQQLFHLLYPSVYPSARPSIRPSILLQAGLPSTNHPVVSLPRLIPANLCLRVDRSSNRAKSCYSSSPSFHSSSTGTTFRDSQRYSFARVHAAIE